MIITGPIVLETLVLKNPAAPADFWLIADNASFLVARSLVYFTGTRSFGINILLLHLASQPFYLRSTMASRALSRKCLHLSHHAPAADVFLHVASRRSVHTQPVLEFLAPRFDQRSLRRVCRLIGGSWPGGSITACRAFSGTHGRRATVAILNPKKDEDGHEMVVDITPRASKVCQIRTAQPMQNPSI